LIYNNNTSKQIVGGAVLTVKKGNATSVWLRKATEDDVGFYFQVRKLTIKPLIEVYRPWDEDAEKRDIVKKVDIKRDRIIMLGEKAIGLFSYFESDEEIYLALINILPEYQSKGIGSNLVLDLKNKADKLDKIVKLDTYQNNFRAIKFFEKAGYKIIASKILPDAYPKVIMQYNPVIE
jgi:ribosomal protein S18 acetylase RimI-like enzyme